MISIYLPFIKNRANLTKEQQINPVFRSKIAKNILNECFLLEEILSTVFKLQKFLKVNLVALFCILKTTVAKQGIIFSVSQVFQIVAQISIGKTQ